MPKRFQKKVEDFTCEHCGREVQGNGYTNHCPFCIWSKHVDNNPGDRESLCGGMMKPIKLEQEKGIFVITHRCSTCNYEKRNVLSPQDDFDTALKVVRIAVDELSK